MWIKYNAMTALIFEIKCSACFVLFIARKIEKPTLKVSHRRHPYAARHIASQRSTIASLIAAKLTTS